MSVCLSGDVRRLQVQFLIDRLGRCLKLIVSYRGTSSHEFASQFGLEFLYTRKNSQTTVGSITDRPRHRPSERCNKKGSAKLDQFLPVRSHFDTKRPVNFFHIATFPSPTFGPLFAFHCPLFFTKNNNLQCRDVLKSNGDYPR